MPKRNSLCLWFRPHSLMSPYHIITSSGESLGLIVKVGMKVAFGRGVRGGAAWKCDAAGGVSLPQKLSGIITLRKQSIWWATGSVVPGAMRLGKKRRMSDPPSPTPSRRPLCEWFRLHFLVSPYHLQLQNKFRLDCRPRTETRICPRRVWWGGMEMRCCGGVSLPWKLTGILTLHKPSN